MVDLVSTARNFIQQAIRVMRVSYRPTTEEFNMTAKITGIGLIGIGIIGYLITLVFKFVDKV